MNRKGFAPIIILLIVVVILIGGGVWYYLARSPNASTQPTVASQQDNQNNLSNMPSLTADYIQNLKTSANDPAGDYFLGTSDEQKAIVAAFIADNSKSDSTYLYIAADTAYRLGDIKDAGFLFYAAQIRKNFDVQRFGLGDADGNNIQTYWGFLNQTIGASVNPAAVKDPQTFSAIVAMISNWQVVPADDALYPQSEYGSPVAPKGQWQTLGDAAKKDFMDNFVAPMEQHLGIKI